MPKDIVVLCDGTGNEIGSTISNVLKLYRMLPRDKGQRVYYGPGVGTIGYENAWQLWKQEARAVFGLATGHGLDADVLEAYGFLSRAYEPGDRIWLFGFSRGAYTVRVLAAFVYVVGLLDPDQLNVAGYAFAAYKRSSALSRRDAPARGGPPPELQAAWDMGRVAGAKPVRIEFVGVWDTVASVIVPRRDTLVPDLQLLRYTRTNPSVKAFRQACAIDERRRMFRLNRWTKSQVFRPDPYDPASEVAQDVREVWFAGVHADIGGGYLETESGLSKYPLWWMVGEARAAGLRTDEAMFRHLVFGAAHPAGRHAYTPPDFLAEKHVSMTAAWKALEWVPKRARWREWPEGASRSGWYLPKEEPRAIPDGALVHRSALRRIADDPSYRPVNVTLDRVKEELRAFALEEPTGPGENADGRAGADQGLRVARPAELSGEAVPGGLLPHRDR